MFSRPDSGTNAVLVALDFGEPGYAESLEELQLLARSGGVSVTAVVRGRRDRPDAALYAGKGKVEEIARIVGETKASVVIFNHALSPIQERNLERQLSCRVVDRTSLILDIFAQRAQPYRQTAGGTCPTGASCNAPGARMESPGTPAWWYRHAQPRRNPA